MKKTYTSLAILWLLFLIYLSVSKSLGYGHSIWGEIEALLGGNRQMHFVMALVLSLLCHRAMATYLQPVKMMNPVMVVLIAGCLLDEGLQYFFPNRNFSLWDATASVSGVVAGLMIVRLWVNKFVISVLNGSR